MAKKEVRGKAEARIDLRPKADPMENKVSISFDGVPSPQVWNALRDTIRLTTELGIRFTLVVDPSKTEAANG